MRRRQSQTGTRNEVEKRCVRRRRSSVDRTHHRIVLMRPSDSENVRKRIADALVLHAKAARDDDAAVLRHRLANRLQAFGLGAVEEAAGVHHDDVRAIVARGDRIALAAQPRENALGIDQRFRAAEADETDLRLGCVLLRYLWHVAILGEIKRAPNGAPLM